MATLSAEQVAQLAYQAGFRGEDLVKITGIARRESGYKTDAWRTDNPGGNTGDVGLWQINYTNVPYLRQAIGISSIQDLLDPVTNARAAFALYRQAGGLFPWNMTSNGWNANGDPLHGVNLDAARQAVQSASDRGMLGSAFDPGSLGSTPSGSAAMSGPLTLPDDAQIYNVAGTYDVFAVFDVGGGIRLSYQIDTSSGAVDWKSKPLQTVSQQQWDQMATVNAGDSGELISVQPVFGNFKGFWDSLMAQVMGPFNPARNDPEVLRVIAEFAARPDMTEAELQNKLQSTQWFQNRTTKELEWNGLSEAEKQKRLAETEADAVQTWFQFVGEQIDPDDPRIAGYIEDLASGKLGFGAFTNIVKSQAAEVGESPWSRTVRDEQEAQRQRGIDIENTAQKVRRTLERWGLKWTDAEIMRWAKDIVSNVASDDDLLNTIQTAASTLYPWKDPQQETLAAAQPWLETYERVMESTGTLFTPEVQQAMTQGTSAAEFEQTLKRSDRWPTTRNGRNELTTLVAAMGSKMGFH